MAFCGPRGRQSVDLRALYAPMLPRIIDYYRLLPIITDYDRFKTWKPYSGPWAVSSTLSDSENWEKFDLNSAASSSSVAS